MRQFIQWFWRFALSTRSTNLIDDDIQLGYIDCGRHWTQPLKMQYFSYELRYNILNDW